MTSGEVLYKTDIIIYIIEIITHLAIGQMYFHEMRSARRKASRCKDTSVDASVFGTHAFNCVILLVQFH